MQTYNHGGVLFLINPTPNFHITERMSLPLPSCPHSSPNFPQFPPHSSNSHFPSPQRPISDLLPPIYWPKVAFLGLSH